MRIQPRRDGTYWVSISVAKPLQDKESAWAAFNRHPIQPAKDAKIHEKPAPKLSQNSLEETWRNHHILFLINQVTLESTSYSLEFFNQVTLHSTFLISPPLPSNQAIRSDTVGSDCDSPRWLSAWWIRFLRNVCWWTLDVFGNGFHIMFSYVFINMFSWFSSSQNNMIPVILGQSRFQNLKCENQLYSFQLGFEGLMSSTNFWKIMIFGWTLGEASVMTLKVSWNGWIPSKQSLCGFSSFDPGQLFSSERAANRPAV